MVRCWRGYVSGSDLHMAQLMPLPLTIVCSSKSRLVLLSHTFLVYEVEGARPRGRPKKTWREIVEKDCQARGLNREDAMDRSRWMKQIRDD